MTLLMKLAYRDGRNRFGIPSTNKICSQPIIPGRDGGQGVRSRCRQASACPTVDEGVVHIPAFPEDAHERGYPGP